VWWNVENRNITPFYPSRIPDLKSYAMGHCEYSGFSGFTLSSSCFLKVEFGVDSFYPSRGYFCVSTVFLWSSSPFASFTEFIERYRGEAVVSEVVCLITASADVVAVIGDDDGVSWGT
jgi:hypothetical protein